MIKITSKALTPLLLSLALFACEKAPDDEQISISIASVRAPISNSASSYQDLQGNPIELADYLGKKVILNYWATWCAPCILEIPSLARAAEILEDDNFIFLLASDEPLVEITSFVEEHELAGNFIKLNAFFASSGIEAVPSTLLLNTEGELMNTWLGAYEWDSPEVLAELRSYDE